ncbi:ATP-binding cassette domain-containing protein, partial [Staphylococcus epidermidis]|uniref:ATP-binding cassette domain-containing protein n=1 Tax=Staphylococcus epidermidis TaxID=1282 RepID=UPI00119DEAE8
NISFSVQKRQFVPVIPPSPSPKTTLLNLLTSIHTISPPTLQVQPKQINKLTHKQLPNFPKQHLPFIFQHYTVLPTLTLKQNIILPL